MSTLEDKKLERQRTIARKYYHRNREKIAAKRRAERDQINARNRAKWSTLSDEEKEQALARCRKYRAANLEAVRARDAARNVSPERKAKMKAWREANRDHRKASMQRWKAARPPEKKRADALRIKALKFKWKYGVGESVYNTLLAKQGGVCAICRRENQQVRNGPYRRLSIDHCHTTGKIRGLLCNDCNTSIGKLGDNEEGLLKALEYLRGSN